MKNIYLMLCLLIAVAFSQTACGQSAFEFTYDASGNRLTRAVILLKSATIDPDSLEAKNPVIPLDDHIGLQKTLIYPNPTKGLLKVDLPGLVDQNAIIRMYDSGGRKIMQMEVVSSGNEIDLSSHPAGFYVMIIQIGQEKKEWKIIKE